MSLVYINNNYSDRDDRKKLEHQIHRYKLVDDKLWGYVLDEGQYIEPLQYSYKNKYGETLNFKQNKMKISSFVDKKKVKGKNYYSWTYSRGVYNK